MKRVMCLPARRLLFVCLVVSSFLFFVNVLLNQYAQVYADVETSWSSSKQRDLRVLVKPDTHTALLSPIACTGQEFLLVVVPSRPTSVLQRHTIRKTWGSWLVNSSASFPSRTSTGRNIKSTYESGFGESNVTSSTMKSFPSMDPKLKFKLVFILGRQREDYGPSLSIVKESNIWGDLLVEDFMDTYQNLTVKSIYILKYVKRLCPKVKYISKVDDDIFLNVPQLQNTLLKVPPEEEVLMGCLFCNSEPIRDPWNKWYTPTHMYPEDVYPNYLSGTSYVISANLVDRLLDAAMSTPLFHLEDIFVTGMLARKIGVRPRDDVGFSFKLKPVDACMYQNATNGHQVSPREMTQLWRSLRSKTFLETCDKVDLADIRRYMPVDCHWLSD